MGCLRVASECPRSRIKRLYGRDNDQPQGGIHIQQQLNEEFSIVETNTVVDPRAVMVHVENASIADTAVMRSIWFPYIAHFTITPPLRLVTHVEAPVGWHNTWICHDALIEGCNQVQEDQVVDEQSDKRQKLPQHWTINAEDKGEVDAKYNAQHSRNKAHAIDALRG